MKMLNLPYVLRVYICLQRIIPAAKCFVITMAAADPLFVNDVICLIPRKLIGPMLNNKIYIDITRGQSLHKLLYVGYKS